MQVYDIVLDDRMVYDLVPNERPVPQAEENTTLNKKESKKFESSSNLAI